MIVPDKIVVKQQNFSVICPGNDAKYHSNRYEYDYVKNTLDFTTKLLCKEMQKKKDFKEHAACFLIKTNTYLIMYINQKNKNNPYFAVYNAKTKEYSTKAFVETFESFKNAPQNFQLLQKRIENTLFKNNLLLPGLMEYMSKIANDYDKESEEEYDFN